jgi:hypothetical protein
LAAFVIEFHGLFSSITFSFKSVNFSMMYLPVYHCYRHHIVAKDAFPITKYLVRRYYQAVALISMRDEFK